MYLSGKGWGMALSTYNGSSVVLAPSPVLGFSLTCQYL